MAGSHDPYVRTPYEWYIAGTWGIASLFLLYAWWRLPGGGPMLIPAGVSGSLALHAILRGASLMGRHRSAPALTRMQVAELLKKPCRGKDRMWFGWGFEWTPAHTQRAMDVMQAGIDEGETGHPGSAWIHGINAGKESDVFIPLKALEGHTLMFGTTGSGKAQPVHARVHTPCGWKLMGALNVGDAVTTPDGGSAMVDGIFPQGVLPMYRIRFADWREVEASGDHLWEVFEGETGLAEIHSTEEILGRLGTPGTVLSIRLTEPAAKPACALAADPYDMGARLAEDLGDASGGTVCIGECYPLFGGDAGSIEQRQALLQGVLDRRGESDVLQGWVRVLGMKSRELVLGIRELAWSLGAMTRVLETASGWDVWIWHPRPRTLFRDSPVRFQLPERAPRRLRILAVEPCGVAEARCIHIRHQDHLYLTDGYIVTHNTRAFEIMVTQAIHRGDAVVMLDPKGDKELRDRMERECRRAGRHDAFAFFHPAFPQTSIRLDPLRNFTRTTEIASRIAALLPSQSGGSDAFTAFSFRALNLVAQGLVEIGEKPTLKSLRYYIEGGPESLLIRAVTAHANRVDPDWRKNAEPYFARAREGKVKKLETIANPEHLAILEFYRQEWSNKRNGSEGIDGLISLVEHNRLHFSKMIASLIPTLNMLTSGELGPLLSPDDADTADPRKIFDTARLISSRHVAYIGLDSLSDAIVASALGSIILSDFASVAGAIYNSGQSPGRISLFVDEAAEVVNVPFIQILNKGRGAGFQVVMATQTLPDLIARTGDEARARQIIGNCNNLISLRIKDGDTQQFVVETFGQTYVRTVQENLSASKNSSHNVFHYSGGAGRSLTFTDSALFPQHLLGKLPNFHYVAALAGGKVVKGRLPVFSD